MNDLRRVPGCRAGRGTAVAIGLAAAWAVARALDATARRRTAGSQNALTAIIAGIGDSGVRGRVIAIDTFLQC
jgi:hypothetical protein